MLDPRTIYYQQTARGYDVQRISAALNNLLDRINS
jgi:hypothetical protein